MVDRRYSGTYKHVAERLMAKIRFDPETHCMIFTGSVNNMGYGSFSGGSDLPGLYYAHRVAYVLWNGPIPEGMELDHRCMNPLCCNPQHLWAVTHRQNASFQRNRSGADHPMGAKTHCPHGHSYDEANTAVAANGERSCRACRLARGRVRYAKHRAENPLSIEYLNEAKKRGVLSDDVVRELRDPRRSQRKAAAEFGVHSSTVSAIRSGKCYGYVV